MPAFVRREKLIYCFNNEPKLSGRATARQPEYIHSGIGLLAVEYVACIGDLIRMHEVCASVMYYTKQPSLSSSIYVIFNAGAFARRPLHAGGRPY